MIFAPKTALDDVPFDDAAPWPTGADGKSIELIDASQSNDNGANWGLTANPTGTPGLPNSTLNTANLATAGAFLQNQYPELNEDVIPLEAGLRDRAISQTKGCYTGQEVIIRILHRGHVNRHLRGILTRAEQVPAAGAVMKA